jgi:lysozyme
MDDSEFQKLRDLLMRNEEFRQRGYEEPTENFGARLGRRYGGVNLRPRVLEQDVRRIAGQLEARWPSFTELDPVRQRVLIHIAFDLSVAGLLMLRRLIMAVECGFWDTAAEEMLASPWANHDRRQAAILAEMMRVGRDLTATQPRTA